MLFAASVSPAAEDPALAKIHTLLAPMRTESLKVGPRGATPVLTNVKHQLRRWIESRLHELPRPDDARALEAQLNAELRRAGLSCDWTSQHREKYCPDRGEPGFLGDVKLDLGEALIVTTEVGIVCGFDQSAYAYSWLNGRWTPFWQSETNEYIEDKYVPLNFLGILLSSQDYENKESDANVRLLLVLARDPAYCESNWYNVYYRVWQLRIDRPEKKLLLDGGEMAFLADWVDGSVTPNDVLFEYSTRTSYGGMNRRVIRHYVLREGKLEREAPLALGPRDFADEWISTDWAVSSQWTSEGVDASSLQPMHNKKNFEGGEYVRTNYCEKRPEHWQVGLDWTDFNGHEMVSRKQMYLLVRWLPPYRFSMTAVSDHPLPGCTWQDRTADEPRTLFPIHSDQTF